MEGALKDQTARVSSLALGLRVQGFIGVNYRGLRLWGFGVLGVRV